MTSSLILMPVMNVWHVAMLMFGARMCMRVRMRFPCQFIRLFVAMKFIRPGMPVFVHDWHVDMEMGVLFICQQPRARDHQNRGDNKQ